jgi:hypothetical protein
MGIVAAVIGGGAVGTRGADEALHGDFVVMIWVKAWLAWKGDVESRGRRLQHLRWEPQRLKARGRQSSTINGISSHSPPNGVDCDLRVKRAGELPRVFLLAMLMDIKILDLSPANKMMLSKVHDVVPPDIHAWSNVWMLHVLKCYPL